MDPNNSVIKRLWCICMYHLDHTWYRLFHCQSIQTKKTVQSQNQIFSLSMFNKFTLYEKQENYLSLPSAFLSSLKPNASPFWRTPSIFSSSCEEIEIYKQAFSQRLVVSYFYGKLISCIRIPIVIRASACRS